MAISIALWQGVACSRAPRGDSAPPKGGLLVVVRTDLSVPKDLNRLEVSFYRGERLLKSSSEVLGPSGLRLPAVFPLRSGVSQGDEIHVRALGYLNDAPQVLAEKWIRYPDEATRQVKLTLSALCVGGHSMEPNSSAAPPRSACGPRSTCVAGRCAPAEDRGTEIGSDVASEQAQGASQAEACWGSPSCFEGLAPAVAQRDGFRCTLRSLKSLDERSPLSIGLSTEGRGTCHSDGSCWVPLPKGEGPDHWHIEGGQLVLPSALCDGDGLPFVVSNRCSAANESLGLCGNGEGGGTPPEAPLVPGPSQTDGPSMDPNPDDSPPISSREPALLACGEIDEGQGGGSSRDTYAIEGTVEGLDEDGLILLLLRSVELPIAKGSTHFRFPVRRPLGSRFEVSLRAAPPSLQCQVESGVGILTDPQERTHVSIRCGRHRSIKQISAGGLHTCALFSDGQVRCWGDSTLGQVADSTPDSNVPGLDHVVQISGGRFHTCALLDDSTVRCWGLGNLGQTGGSSAHESIEGLSGVVEVRAGKFHTCARREGGTIRCWGYNGYGATLGGGPTADLEGLSGVAELALGYNHTCVRMDDSTVRCWGDPVDGKLAGSSPEFGIVGLSGVTQIAAGAYHTCGLLRQGTVRCWGSNGAGQVISGPDRDVPGVSGVQAVAAGVDTTWTLQSGGWIQCWGFPLHCPSQGMALPTQALELTVGSTHLCTRDKDSAVWCWGRSAYGQVVGSYAVQPIPGLSGVRELSLSATHACALREDGGLRCWGAFESFTHFPDSSSPTQDLPTVPRAAGVSVSEARTCLVSRAGQVHCAGLFGPNQGSSFRAGPVRGLSGVVDVVASESSLCALLSDSTVRCWGYGSSPDLPPSSTTQSIPGLSGVVQMAVGSATFCAVLARGTVRCWSANNNEFGQAPVQSFRDDIPGLSGVKEVSVGEHHVCALLLDTTVRCWGSNAQAQTAGSSPSASIAGLSGVVQIRAGYSHTCARLENGTVRCWGANNTNQTGGSTPALAVPFVENAESIAVGGTTSCAVLCGGRVLCWGNDSNGQASGRGYQVAPVPLSP